MAAVDTARAHAQAVLRVRGLALAAAAMPAAVAVVLLAGRFTGRIGAPGSSDAVGWDAARWVVCAVAALTLLVAGLTARAYHRAVPPRTPAVPLKRAEAPELYRLIDELADRLDVPAPSTVALTPDCDSWLEDVPPVRRARPFRAHPEPPGPVLVIGSPFLWWMRAGELRALLAPVVAGTAASADPEIAAARRFLRSLDASLDSGQGAAPGLGGGTLAGPPRPPRRGPAALAERITRGITRRLLGACRGHAAELERSVASWASEQARTVDYGLRIAAQEQVGLAYAGWDRLLTRVALPAWRLGRHPAHLNAGVVSALTELSRRDRLADGYGTRLGDRPACDLLEEPGTVDRAVSRLAAELFFGSPAAGGWHELEWTDYPADVVDAGWRARAAALQTALDRLAPRPAPAPRRSPGCWSGSPRARGSSWPPRWPPSWPAPPPRPRCSKPPAAAVTCWSTTSPRWSAAPPSTPRAARPAWTGWTVRCCCWAGSAAPTWPGRSPRPSSRARTARCGPGWTPPTSVWRNPSGCEPDRRRSALRRAPPNRPAGGRLRRPEARPGEGVRFPAPIATAG